MAGISQAARFAGSKSRFLAAVYLTVLISAFGIFVAYGYRAPKTVDQGVAILIRSVAHRWSFGPVSKARQDVDRGDLESAAKRLTRFISRNASVQRSQLMTRSLVDAHVLLADIFSMQGRLGRVEDTFSDLTDIVPLHYRAWYLRGRAESLAGDLPSAADSLREAFRLSLNNHAVVEAYLEVLAELSDFERILWVEDQFRRAEIRALPTAEVKLGVPRRAWQTYFLSKVGIPVEHGRHFRKFEVAQLDRGADRWLTFPEDVFEEWPQGDAPLVIQFRFEHVFEDLKITAARFKDAMGNSKTVSLEADAVRYLHIPHASSRYHAEFELDVDPSQISALEVRYSCPRPVLSRVAVAIIDKARANVSATGGKA